MRFLAFEGQSTPWQGFLHGNQEDLVKAFCIEKIGMPCDREDQERLQIFARSS